VPAPDAASFAGGYRTHMPTNTHSDDPLVQKLHDVDRLAEAGASEKTPLILIGRVWLVTAAAVAVIFVLAMLAYFLAT
jgi:hypothetical protein